MIFECWSGWLLLSFGRAFAACELPGVARVVTIDAARDYPGTGKIGSYSKRPPSSGPAGALGDLVGQQVPESDETCLPGRSRRDRNPRAGLIFRAQLNTNRASSAHI